MLEGAREKLPGRYLLEYYVGMLANRLGRTQQAIPALEKSSQLEPTSPDPFYELGKLYVGQQDWPRASQALERAIALNPLFAPAHYQLSRVYAHLGLNAQAAEESQTTRRLVDEQRDEALRKQRERGAGFQSQASAPASQ